MTSGALARVIDVSLDGAALELPGSPLDGGLAGPLYLQIASVAGDQAGVVIRAVIRGSRKADGGGVIVGIEFLVLHADERQLLQLLVELRSPTLTVRSTARHAHASLAPMRGVVVLRAGSIRTSGRLERQ